MLRQGMGGRGSRLSQGMVGRVFMLRLSGRAPCSGKGWGEGL
jgi:hypothetical protein